MCGWEALAADTKKVEPPRLVVQSGIGNQVRAVAFSPDSKTLVSASSDITLKLWGLEWQRIWNKQYPTKSAQQHC